MIIALDIETIPIPEAVALMPEPEVKIGNTKDPAKIAEKIAEAKAALSEKAALNPLTARVASYAIVGEPEPGSGTQEHFECIHAATDDKEAAVVQSIMEMMSDDTLRLVTFNGWKFDIPFVYRRALILGIDPRGSGAPPESAWLKKYSHEKHCDLRQEWTGWDTSQFPSLDMLSRMILGKAKLEHDHNLTATMILTEEGRAKLREYNMQDARLTWELWNRFRGTLFA